MWPVLALVCFMVAGGGHVWGGGCHWPMETSLQRGLLGHWDQPQAEAHKDHDPDRAHHFLHKLINPHLL